MRRETHDGDSEGGAGRWSPGGIRSQRMSSCGGLVEERLVCASARYLAEPQSCGSADEGLDSLGDRGSSRLRVSSSLSRAVGACGSAGESQACASHPAVLRTGSSPVSTGFDAFPCTAGDCRSREIRRPDERSLVRSYGGVLHRLHRVDLCGWGEKGVAHGSPGHQQPVDGRGASLLNATGRWRWRL